MAGMFGSRRGVSPLIAAVLLIAFTMAVAAILTAWVTTFTKKQTGTIGNKTSENIECSFANMEILSVDWPSTGTTGGTVTVAVTNSGNEPLTNISVTVFDGSTVLTLSGDRYASLPEGSTTSLSPTAGSGTPNRVRVQSSQCPAVSTTASR